MTISSEIIECIKKHTSELDVTDVARATGAGFHTVRRLRLGELKINNNERVESTLLLMEKALENSKDSQNEISQEQAILDQTIKTFKNEKSIENIQKLQGAQ
ncbi:Uncharacterised protein [Chryseobacterium nakagawai]|uniref:Uncharacterized protein n=1 Tax=Chryseobacterium nakagawai TaxID=1241982 RepID=A0AAD0YKZ8_CHRNA|nr:hypothetical protein [Chryseobacterium nakagawai]AZA91185.1 hypothetical protein EG343_11355 [Chryseobacterium nakagawai]VEH22751.1 Uncharacterised protein [Chryseobacterium nakagawai]